MKPYFNESYLTIHYDASLDCVYSNWTQSPTSTEFKTGMNRMIDAMKDFKTGRLMSDTANIGAIDPDDQAWSSSAWLEKAIKEAGYRQFAVIISPDLFAQMSVEDTLATVQTTSTVEIRYFENKKTASEWLQETK